jgi:hypothetical protein
VPSIFDADPRPDEVDLAGITFFIGSAVLFAVIDFLRWGSGHEPTLALLYGPTCATQLARQLYRDAPLADRLRFDRLRMLGMMGLSAGVLAFALLQHDFTRDRWLIGGAMVYLLAIPIGWKRARRRELLLEGAE